jgi:hypothetical protein
LHVSSSLRGRAQGDSISVLKKFELAAAFVKLYWPDFNEVDGSIFLAEQYSEANYRAWRERGVARDQVESVINHCHVYDLFLNADRDQVDPVVFETIGKTLQKTWACALSDAFPNRTFTFSFATEPDAYGPTLTFCELPPSNS